MEILRSSNHRPQKRHPGGYAPDLLSFRQKGEGRRLWHTAFLLPYIFRGRKGNFRSVRYLHTERWRHAVCQNRCCGGWGIDRQPCLPARLHLPPSLTSERRRQAGGCDVLRTGLIKTREGINLRAVYAAQSRLFLSLFLFCLAVCLSVVCLPACLHDHQNVPV